MTIKNWFQSLRRSTLEKHRTLVLKSDGLPLEYPLTQLNGKDTLTGLFLGRFHVVKFSDTWVSTATRQFQLPSVVQLRRYAEPINLRSTPSLSLENLFKRDGGICQYTSNSLRIGSPNPEVQATIDHVLPRALGGKQCSIGQRCP